MPYRRGSPSQDTETVAETTAVAEPETEQELAELTRADRLARRILRIEDEAPGALFPMQGSLVLSAVRCLVTYVAIPLLVPVFGWLTPIAAPLSLLLTVVAGAMAITSLRRVWTAHWDGRWGYTAFAVAVLVSLAGLLVFDLRALVA